MPIKIYTIDDDNVIGSKFITGKTNYAFAVEHLYELINKLTIQRNLQNPTFYKRLRRDLLRECIIPPITLAFILDKDELPIEVEEATEYINLNIKKAFILDGIQRLNALHQAYTEPELDVALNLTRPLFVNVLICKSMDNLLYRMITLNNGQKPMTANHQIEILLGNIYDFDDLDIVIQTEKSKGAGKVKHSFEKSNIIKSYLAFLSNSTAIDNNKIIESKLDELIARKIIDSNITEDGLEYSDIIKLINNFSEDSYLKKWFDNVNNIIGFSVGIRKSFKVVQLLNTQQFKKSINVFEETFSALKLSTIKLSRERRNLSNYFISNYDTVADIDEIDLLGKFNDEALN
ncbi:hypothetical protein DYU05_12645 [Mucilaginibacter terrenus]|uniref:DUF262 domain-containing protein n=1 Tax=Mucilaginibacter terrenus TaxID=2482727 RepID=A0A3E2NPR2_9SPHI|nr:hypothetical protein [Mucilaginibacter terrenus]RFZ82996.1 hypothetical protein DYU05_12645 [Mucilaginibacter terrenus]